MMTNLLHGAHVANKLFSTIARLRLLLVMFVALTISAEVWGEEITYKHVFTTKPSIGNNTLSNITWSVEATNLNNYNNDYAGVQFGTSKANGSITLTSVNAWGEQSNTSYTGYTNVKYVYVWLNAGSGTPTATVTIGGKAASKSGTVSKNTAANRDYEKTSKLTFTPTSNGNTGVIVITASTSSKAGYIAAIEVVCETPAASCTSITPSLSYTPSSLSVGGTANPTLSGNSGNGSVTYSSSNTSVATINASTGVVTAKAAGTTTITANIAANNGYCEGTATAQITVTPNPYTVTLNAGPGTCAESVTEFSAGAGVELPEPTLDCGDWEFAGWKTTSAVTTETTTEPTLIPAGNYKPTANTTLYAVYQRTDGGGGGSTPTEVSQTYIFSDYEVGTQYAEETYELDDDVTINITGCHINTQLRVYGAQPGIVISKGLPGRIVSMGFNMGYKADNLVVSGSTDGTSWNEVGRISTTTSYEDYTLDFGETNYTYFKLNVEGSSQIRIAKMSITYESTSGGGSSSNTYYHSTPECTAKPTVYLIPKCGGDGGGTWLVVIEWFATF